MSATGIYSCQETSDNDFPFIVFSLMVRLWLSLVFIVDNTAFTSSSVHWRSSAQMIFRSVLCLTMSIFGRHVTQNFLEPSSLMMAIITGLPIPLAVQISRVVMGLSSLTSASNLPLLSVITAVAGRPLRGLSTMTFSPHLRWTHTRSSDFYESQSDWSLPQ